MRPVTLRFPTPEVKGNFWEITGQTAPWLVRIGGSTRPQLVKQSYQAITYFPMGTVRHAHTYYMPLLSSQSFHFAYCSGCYAAFFSSFEPHKHAYIILHQSTCQLLALFHVFFVCLLSHTFHLLLSTSAAPCASFAQGTSPHTAFGTTSCRCAASNLLHLPAIISPAITYIR